MLEKNVADFPVLQSLLLFQAEEHSDSLEKLCKLVQTSFKRGGLSSQNEYSFGRLFYEVLSGVRFARRSVSPVNDLLRKADEAYPAIFNLQWGASATKELGAEIGAVKDVVSKATDNAELAQSACTALDEILELRQWHDALQIRFEELRLQKDAEKKGVRAKGAESFVADIERFPQVTAVFDAYDQEQNQLVASGARRKAFLLDFPKLLATLGAGLERGIVNPVYLGLKDDLNNGLTTKFKAVRGALTLARRRPEHVTEQEAEIAEACADGLPYDLTLANLGSVIKKIAGFKKLYGDGVPACVLDLESFALEAQPLVSGMSALKDKVVKRGSQKEVAADGEENEETEVRRELAKRYIPDELTKKLVAVFNDATEPQVKTLTEYFNGILQASLKALRELGPIEDVARRLGCDGHTPSKEERIPPESPVAQVFRLVVERKDRRSLFVVASDVDERLHREADHSAQALRRGFVYKTTLKVASIIEAKGSEFSASHLPGTQSLGRLEGDFVFSFPDGSSFRVDCKSEIGRSIYDREFARYPTRFHDVFLEDGKAMSLPSEERMNTVFAATLYGSVNVSRAFRTYSPGEEEKALRMLVDMGVRLGAKLSDGRQSVSCSRNVAAKLTEFKADYEPELHEFSPAVVLGLPEDEQKRHALARKAWESFHGSHGSAGLEEAGPVAQRVPGKRSVQHACEVEP